MSEYKVLMFGKECYDFLRASQTDCLRWKLPYARKFLLEVSLLLNLSHIIVTLPRACKPSYKIVNGVNGLQILYVIPMLALTSKK